MKPFVNLRVAAALIVAGMMAAASAGSALAQTYPSKPVRIIIGNPPGSVVDVTIRPVAEELTRRMGQPVIVENRPGANSRIGAKAVVGASPDGYTLFYSLVMQSHSLFVRENSVDAGKDLLPVSQLVSTPWVLVVRSSLPVTTLQELVAYSKANPGSLKHGAPAAIVDIPMKVLGDRAGFESRSIPYKSSPQVMVALLSGEVDLGMGSAQTYTAQLQAGKVRALFALATKRVAVVPDVPAASEVGLPNFEVPAYYGLWAPLGTPRDIIAKLSAEAAAAVRTPAIVEQIRKSSGGEALGTTPEEQMKQYEAEVRFWTEAIRATGYKAE